MTETWGAMTARHKRERRAMVSDLAAQRLTQTQAARILKTTLQRVNHIVRRDGIHWPVIRQGVRL